MDDHQLSSKRDTLTENSALADFNLNLVYKIILVGDAGVGKSGLLLRFADDTFLQNYNSTLGVDFKFRTVRLNGRAIKLQIWDTSGQERFRAITANYYRNIHGVMIVYDVTSQKSFENLNQWLEEICRNADEEVSKMIVGNKCDLEDNIVVETSTAEAYAVHSGCSFQETSAKDDTNVDRAFITMATDINNRLGSHQSEQSNNINIDSRTADRRKRCC